MGSEPFQFTDAPFHLRAEGQKERVRAAGPTQEPPPSLAHLSLAHLKVLSPGRGGVRFYPLYRTPPHSHTNLRARPLRNTKAPKTAGGAGRSFIHSFIPATSVYGEPPCARHCGALADVRDAHTSESSHCPGVPDGGTLKAHVGRPIYIKKKILESSKCRRSTGCRSPDRREEGCSREWGAGWRAPHGTWGAS